MTMNQNNSFQMFKFGKCNVRGSYCSSSLFAHDSKTNMSLLDHGHIIATITNGSSDWSARGGFDQFDNLTLLERRQPAANNC